jgi:XRE family transcriptional regulator, regulator of sulfur utilization
MITRRDGLVAFLAASAATAACWAAQAELPAVMPSSVFDWTKLEVEPTQVGERRAVFDSRSATLDRVECHVTTIRAGEAPHPPHRHVEEELIIVKEGTIEAMQNGETTVVGPGSVLFEASNDLHGLKNVGDTPASYFVIKWWPHDLAQRAD